MTFDKLKEKYGLKEKMAGCDFNAVKVSLEKGRWVHAYTAHRDAIPANGEMVICYQGDDAVWMRGVVRDTPLKALHHYDTLGYTFVVDLDWDDYGYIEEDTFSEWEND